MGIVTFEVVLVVPAAVGTFPIRILLVAVVVVVSNDDNRIVSVDTMVEA